MHVLQTLHTITYVADSGDWRITIDGDVFRIEPQVGQWEYGSGGNLDTLAALIVAARADAIARGLNWSDT